jgi:hypothetical protein
MITPIAIAMIIIPIIELLFINFTDFRNQKILCGKGMKYSFDKPKQSTY